MENFYLIHFCDASKFRVYLNSSNSEVTKKFTEINRSKNLTQKFVLVIEAVRKNIANKSQFNWEAKCKMGEIYAIKVDEHRFYTLVTKNLGYRELYICRYGKKQSDQNSKKLIAIIESIGEISLQKILSS